jgi:hypothetical protein
MTIYSEFLVYGVKAYINNDYIGIHSNMHMALNCALQKQLTENEFLTLLNKSKDWLDDLEESGVIQNE